LGASSKSVRFLRYADVSQIGHDSSVLWGEDLSATGPYCEGLNLLSAESLKSLEEDTPTTPQGDNRADLVTRMDEIAFLVVVLGGIADWTGEAGRIGKTDRVTTGIDSQSLPIKIQQNQGAQFLRLPKTVDLLGFLRIFNPEAGIAARGAF
jgi:hypothetical protein